MVFLFIKQVCTVDLVVEDAAVIVQQDGVLARLALALSDEEAAVDTGTEH